MQLSKWIQHFTAGEDFAYDFVKHICGGCWPVVVYKDHPHGNFRQQELLKEINKDSISNIRPRANPGMGVHGRGRPGHVQAQPYCRVEQAWAGAELSISRPRLHI